MKNPIASVDLSWFDSPENEAQLQRLDAFIQDFSKREPTAADFEALLSVFERFPCHDGFGVFWSIVHCLEHFQGYEPALLDSVRRRPGEFNLTMINRMMNAGVANVGDVSLIDVLQTVAASETASQQAREIARDFIAAPGKRTALPTRPDKPPAPADHAASPPPSRPS